MELTVLQRIHSGLLERKRNLSGWLHQTAPEKRQEQLGDCCEEDVQPQLLALDAALAKAKDHSLGVCTVCHEHVEARLLEMDYTCCVCLDHLSSQERRQLEAELEFTQLVQRSLLPQQPPAFPRLDIAVFSRPAQIVGGDTFDFFHFRDGAHGLAVADAMGHGMSASILMTSLQTALRAIAPECHSPAQALERVNRLFVHNASITTFATAFLARYIPASGELEYCNAGHPPALWLRRGGQESVWLPPAAAAIGLIEDYRPQSERLTLSTGDALVLYTDGLNEAAGPAGESFGHARLKEAVSAAAAGSAQDILQAARAALSGFTAGRAWEDDVTLWVGKFT